MRSAIAVGEGAGFWFRVMRYEAALSVGLAQGVAIRLDFHDSRPIQGISAFFAIREPLREAVGF